MLHPGPKLLLERGRIPFADQSRTRNFGRRSDKGCIICCLDSGDTLERERERNGNYSSVGWRSTIYEYTHFRSIHRMSLAYPSEYFHGFKRPASYLLWMTLASRSSRVPSCWSAAVRKNRSALVGVVIGIGGVLYSAECC